jgi:DNA-binding NarL/FixJ family response regulator
MRETSRPRVLIADDHALIAEALNKLLDAEFDVVGIVHDGRRLVQTAQELRPDVILVDIGMPLLNGMQAAQRIKRLLPAVKLVYVTINQDPDLIAEAFRRGASGYLPKTSAGSELVVAIRTVLRGEMYVSPLLAKLEENEKPRDYKETIEINSRPVEEPACKVLTDRQLEVLQLLAEGKSMKEVAAVLNLATRTVAFHKYRLMQNLHLKNDAEVVQYAIRQRIIF